MKRILIYLVLIGGLALLVIQYAQRASAQAKPALRMAAIQRGDLVSTISATGTLEPEEVVDVGAQVAGRIQGFGVDPHDPQKFVDYGCVVEQGTVLARIDPIPYEAALEQAEATLEKSEADLLQLEARLEQAEHDWKRAENLHKSNSIADADYDSAVSTYKIAKANLAEGKAVVRQNRAALRIAKTNLGYTTITSPVRGVIIDRRVNVGQTVVASLNAPSLFLIAKDLRRIQVWASVNEADIGQIHQDMPVRFTIDAYPGRTYAGRVTQLRMAATMTQNVVTYTVVVTTENADGKLLPYMTANVAFETEKRSGVLLVPSAALRWKPEAAQVAPNAAQAPTVTAGGGQQGCLWVGDQRGLVRPLAVTVGPTDGTQTEVRGDGVQAGTQVVVGEEGDNDAEGVPAADGEGTSNPFLPKPAQGAKLPPPPM